MIHLILEIVNPFSKKFSGLFSKHGRITKFKSWELNAYRTNTILLIAVDFSVKKDHAGVGLRLGVAGLEIELQIHDIRHWDYKSGRWE